MRVSSAYRTKLTPRRSRLRSSSQAAIFAKNNDIDVPWGIPRSLITELFELYLDSGKGTVRRKLSMTVISTLVSKNWPFRRTKRRYSCEMLSKYLEKSYSATKTLVWP